MPRDASHANRSRLSWAGFLLGFALSGFFDGILLHQVLQWHHLLSGLEGARFEDLRFQVLADGLFHVAMYVIGLVGLIMLWRARGAGSQRQLLTWALIGFGVWHILDGILSHWILGIHRIRMDSAYPLFWDLLWFVLFGVVFILAGLWLHRRDDGGGGTEEGRGGRGAALALSLAVMIAAPWAALPPPDSDSVVVIFARDTAPEDAMAAVAAIGARPIWSDEENGIWAIAPGPDGEPRQLYGQGAILVSGSAAALGCLAWIRA